MICKAMRRTRARNNPSENFGRKTRLRAGRAGKEASPLKKATFALSVAALTVAPSFAADAAAGKAVYDRACKSCHGADGAPNPAIAKAMNVTMPDLKSPEVQSESEAEMKKIITTGKAKCTPLPASTANRPLTWPHT